MKEDAKLIKKAAKEILAPHGVYQKGQSRLWLDDNGWFLTVVEFLPMRGPGSALNTGVNFLWTPKDYISFDLYERENDFAEYKGNEVKFYKNMRRICGKALDKVLYYKKFQDMTFAKNAILAYEAPMEAMWGRWDKAMFCFLNGEADLARSYLDEFSKFQHEHNSWINDFVKAQTELFGPVRHDAEAARQLVLQAIEKQRELFRSKKIIRN